MRRLALCVVVALAACRAEPHQGLAAGTPAPAFSLPGTDGRTHTLTDYQASPLLAVVFTCNHCPASMLYERRIQRLHDDYRGKGVALVAINPDSTDALGPADLAYTDVGDSLSDMKARAAYRHFDFPYLYDGDTQAAAKAFGVTALPQIFVFDRDRRLQYEGRIDDSVDEAGVRERDAREAIDALLAGRPVPRAHATASGCAPAWRAAGAPERREPVAVRRARLPRDGGTGCAEDRPRQRHRQARARELLGDLVRPLRGGVPGSGRDASHVPVAAVRVRQHL